MEQEITFKLGTLTNRGMVELSTVGRDLIRAILYKWLIECDASQAKAREWADLMPVGRYAGQVTYWKNCASFIVGKLCNNLPLRFNAGKYLPLLVKWPAGTMAPERWASELFYSLAQAVPDEPTELTTGGSGADGHVVPGVDPVASDGAGAVGEAVPDPEGPDNDPSADRAEDGCPDGAGPPQPGPTDRRGGPREPAGTPDRNGGAKPTGKGRNPPATGRGKQGRK